MRVAELAARGRERPRLGVVGRGPSSRTPAALRYAGLLWTKPDRWDKLDAKGIETVRRDNCLLVRRVVGTCLDRILKHEDVKGAIDFTKGVISDLLQNKLDISLLVITKVRARASREGGKGAPR